MRSRRGAAVFCLGVVLASMLVLVTPAGARVSTDVSHLWKKQLKPLATKLFYTKKQSNARYYKKSASDARYYTKAGSDARYYTTGDADARFSLKGGPSNSGLLGYCIRARANPRSYPAELCGASLVLTLDSGGVVGEFTSLALGADGLPLISYRDATNADLKILHCGNESCTAGNQATTADAPGNVGANTALAIGADGLPVVAYKDVAAGDLKILHCGNVACTSGNVATAVDAGAPDVGTDTSVAIGDDGFPVVSYVDGTNTDLKVLHCGNVACSSGNQATVVDAGPVAADTGSSIAVGTDGLPVVSYYRQDEGNLRVLHCGNAACTSGSNQSTTVDDDPYVGDFSSLAIGLDGLPVVSYRDGTTGNLKIVHCGDVTCTVGNELTPVDTSAYPLGYYTSLAIGPAGFPVVSYYDSATSDLKVVSCGNAACTADTQVLPIDTAGSVGRHTAIAIGVDGLPLVSYYDESAGDLKLARPPVPPLP